MMVMLALWLMMTCLSRAVQDDAALHKVRLSVTNPQALLVSGSL